jgi:signal transduction histidine kinase
MDQVTRLLEVEEGSLLLTDEPTGDLVFAYTTGPVGNQLRGLRLPRGTGIAGYVITSGQSIIVNDAQRDGRFDSTTDRTTGFVTRRMLAVPLRGLSGALGVIEVINRRDNRPFTDEDRRLLEALADYAVIAIENARRFAQVDQALARRAQDLARINDRLQHNLRSLTALNALGMAINTSLRNPDEVYRMTTRGVVEMTGAHGAWMLLRQGNEWRVAITVGPTLTDEQALIQRIRHVAETGRPELLTDDLPQALTKLDMQALLIVPMRATRETLGYLCVGYADNPPDAPDRETVVLFATQAASSVESMLLFSAVSSARDEMASVLASTREGIMLVGSDRRVAVVNARLRELCELRSDPTGQTLEQFLANWEQEAGLLAEEWLAFQRGFRATVDRQEAFVSGEIGNIRGRVLEWAAIEALSSGDSHGGALLVLRDITEAKESEKLRQDLTHMIVHDLRSPLSSVMASIDMLMRGVTGETNNSQQHVLSIANDSSQQMLGMINTLLDISRLEAGRMPLSLAMVDICPLIERAVSQMASLAHDRGIILATTCDPATPMIHADAALVVRVAQNLVANAIKFSGRSGVVTVMVGPSPDGVIVHVRDQGIGIAPMDRDKIFAKFGQVGERRGGTGLGLTFCKLVLEAHNGRIWVDSQVGEGSTFSFTLPTEAPTSYNRTSSPS